MSTIDESGKRFAAGFVPNANAIIRKIVKIIKGIFRKDKPAKVYVMTVKVDVTAISEEKSFDLFETLVAVAETVAGAGYVTGEFEVERFKEEKSDG